MILNANSRAYGGELARHLLNVEDNEHATVHELRGFVSDDLAGAFREAEAISQATQCRQYLFSLSLNPPKAANVSFAEFEAVISRIEERLGLSGQPRAIVFHEKLGRRHAHCVWSRINGQTMRAINLPHFKRKLTDISRDLYREHGWEMPRGLANWQAPDPLNFDHAEAGQAKRVKRDPAKLKAMFKGCLTASDSLSSFAAALKEHGYVLARGDRRGFVAVDANGEVYSLSRWCGVKAKELRHRFGEEADLPSVEEATLTAQAFLRQPFEDATAVTEINLKRKALADLVERQRAERGALKQTQAEREVEAIRQASVSLPTGMRAVWAKLSGSWQTQVGRLADEAKARQLRDGAEVENLIQRHLAERRALDRETTSDQLKDQFAGSLQQRRLGETGNAYALDPAQPLVLPPDENAILADRIRQNPSLVIDEIARHEASFTRSDILRRLANYIDDPLELRTACDTALRCDELVALDDENEARFTTRAYQKADRELLAQTVDLAAIGHFKVSERNTKNAISAFNTVLGKRYGSALTEEQCLAIRHVLSPKQLNAVVGWAGTGKSTMLQVAKDAWEQQGYNVYGLALAGKAADSLESAAGISSRTLASLEASWKAGYEPIEGGSVVVLDESGMVGTNQLQRIVDGLRQRGCKLVLVGDPDQLQPIEAGTPFRTIVETVGAEKLTEIRRQSKDWQREASRHLANGRIEDALSAYRDKGLVVETHDRDSAIAALVDDLAATYTGDGQQTSQLALAHRRKDVHAINQSVRSARKANDPEFGRAESLVKTDHGPRAFAVGDRLLFTRNDRDLGVRNGMLATVTKADTDELTVRFDEDEGAPRAGPTFKPSEFASIDHGYAVTIHRAQGCTVDNAFVLSSGTMDEHLTYVAMTRHREDMNFYSALDISRKHSKARRQKRSLIVGLRRTR